MFRCDNCGSGYSTEAASSWQFCPRCLARQKISVPLTFELGWRRQGRSAAEAKSGEESGAGAAPPGRPTSTSTP